MDVLPLKPVLTVDQRLRALERIAVVQTDSLRILHNLVKENKKQISEFIINGLKKAVEDG